MEGIHDLGGMQGFGRVQHRVNSESYKPVFSTEWEYLGYPLLYLGAEVWDRNGGGGFSVDEYRHAVERLDPVQYASTSYFDRVIAACASLLVEKGIVTTQELEAEAGGKFPLAHPSAEGRSSTPPRDPMTVGSLVTVSAERIHGHSRLPSYLFGKTGTILHRTTVKWPFPDSIAHGIDSDPEPSYHVEFSAAALWGDSNNKDSVVVDLFESYLTLSKAGHQLRFKCVDNDPLNAGTVV